MAPMGASSRHPFTYVPSCIGPEKLEEVGSQGYREWTPFSSLDFRVVPLYMQTQKKKMHHKLSFGLHQDLGWVCWPGRQKKFGEKGKGDLIGAPGSSLTGLELGIIRL